MLFGTVAIKSMARESEMYLLNGNYSLHKLVNQPPAVGLSKCHFFVCRVVACSLSSISLPKSSAMIWGVSFSLFNHQDEKAITVPARHPGLVKK